MDLFERNIKDKLAGYESCLPEDGLARFRDRLDASAGTDAHDGKVSPLLIVIPALAAGLALFLTLGNRPETADPVPMESAPHYAQASGTFQEPSTIPDSPTTLPTPATNIPGKKASEGMPETTPEDMPGNPSENALEAASEPIDETAADTKRDTRRAEEKKTVDATDIRITESAGKVRRNDIRINADAAASGTLAVGAAIAFANVFPKPAPKGTALPYGYEGKAADVALSPDPFPGMIPLSFETIHNIPAKVGLSLRIPLSDKLFITTGLDWSLYSSSSSNPYFKSKQKVQYLGIPLKLNFSIARNERLDVYLGAGGAAEFCTSAKIDGKDISRDGPGFSFLGAVGVQFNLTDSFGLYLEPELSWTVPSGKAVLSTYRSEHPTMFSIASGVRITLH